MIPPVFHLIGWITTVTNLVPSFPPQIFIPQCETKCIFTPLFAKFFCLGKSLHIRLIIWHNVFTSLSCSFSNIVRFFTSVVCPTSKIHISYLPLIPVSNSSYSPVCKILHQYEAYSQSSHSVSTKFPFCYPVSPPSSNISNLFLLIANLTHFFMYLFISSLYIFRASQCSSSGDRIDFPPDRHTKQSLTQTNHTR